MIQKTSSLAARLRQVYRRIGLGTKLTTLLLPIVLIPMLIVVVFTYQRAREILR
nr:hypothetical protein [Anaerolineales bacterium]